MDHSLYLSLASASAIALAALVSTSPASGQVRSPRHVTRPSETQELRLDPRSYYQDRLIVKFVEGARVRLRDMPAHGPTRTSQARLGADLTSPDGLDLRATHALLAALPIARVFTRTVQDLEAERAALTKRAHALAAALPPDLNNYYQVRTRGRNETLRVLRGLLADPAVETAYPEFSLRAAVPAQGRTKATKAATDNRRNVSPIQTPFLEGAQRNLAAAPSGLGFLPALGIAGVEGRPDQNVVQVEAAWYFGHEDLPQLIRSRILGPKSFGYLDIKVWRDHGTATVGVISASRDNKGVRGIVPRSKLWVSSTIRGNGNAVSRATKIAKPGDMFTSSLVHAVYYRARGYHTPFDLPQDAYDAVRIAVLKGIVVTCAAGNTGADLANTAIYGTRYLPQSSPSGAIIVGATLGAQNKKVTWSNYGSVVKLSAWGSSVPTTAYGHAFRAPESPNLRSYTTFFGGTSAASPQVGSIAASLQSVAITQTGKPLSPNQVLAVLRRYGTPIAGGVGPRPNLEGTLEALGLVSGLRAVGETIPGGKLTLALELQSNELFILLASLRPQRLPAQGFSFPVLIDPATMFVVSAGSMPLRSPLLQPLRVPGGERLIGAHLYFQSVRFSPKTRNLDLTNAVDVWLRSPRQAN